MDREIGREMKFPDRETREIGIRLFTCRVTLNFTIQKAIIPKAEVHFDGLSCLELFKQIDITNCFPNLQISCFLIFCQKNVLFY